MVPERGVREGPHRSTLVDFVVSAGPQTNSFTYTDFSPAGDFVGNQNTVRNRLAQGEEDRL